MLSDSSSPGLSSAVLPLPILTLCGLGARGLFWRLLLCRAQLVRGACTWGRHVAEAACRQGCWVQLHCCTDSERGADMTKPIAGAMHGCSRGGGPNCTEPQRHAPQARGVYATARQHGTIRPTLLLTLMKVPFVDVSCTSQCIEPSCYHGATWVRGWGCSLQRCSEAGLHA